MIVSDLIKLLEKLPQDATLISGGTDYPAVVEGIRKIPIKKFDGYYYPEYGTNKNWVIAI
jgi:hypothetical protein